MSPGRSGPDPDAITRYMVETHPDTIVAHAGGGTFFSCDESNWPSLATITTTDEYVPSDLGREGRFRLNVNPSETTFDAVVKPLLEEAHGRVATKARPRRRP